MHCRLKRHGNCCFIRIILQKSWHSKIHRLFGLQFNLVKGVCRQFFLSSFCIPRVWYFGRLKRSEHPNRYLLQRKYSQYGLPGSYKKPLGNMNFFFQAETPFLTINSNYVVLTYKEAEIWLLTSLSVFFLLACYSVKI